MASKKCPNCGTYVKLPPSTPFYMLTFGDLNSLLLTFFVLIVALSTTDIKKFNIVLSSFKGTLGTLEGGATITTEEMLDMGNNPEVMTEEISFEQAMEIITTLKQEFKAGEIQIHKESRGIVIQVTDNILFQPGEVELKDANAKDVLKRVGILLNEIVPDRQIRVEGHTDNKDFEAKKLVGSNWELSALRAANVVKYLINEVNVASNRLAAVGYGSEKPIAGTKEFQTDEERARNRRVDIVILSKREIKE